MQETPGLFGSLSDEQKEAVLAYDGPVESGRALVRSDDLAAAARVGIPAEASAHWLRHAHASHSLERGAPIHLVQATLGHAWVATTGRYLHARPSDSSARYLGV
jgi:site-specific recombinase XerC